MINYTATGKVDSHLFRGELKATGYSYKSLTENMAKVTEDIRYFTEGVSGGINSSDQEPYTKNLIWPRVNWKITKVEKND